MKNIMQLSKSLLLFTVFLISGLALSQTEKVNEEQIESLISKKINMDKDGDFKDRYTIQIFYGEYRGAQGIKTKYDATDMIWKVEQKYEEPNHKVWIGNFRSKLAAERALIEVRKEFPSAFILKP